MQGLLKKKIWSWSWSWSDKGVSKYLGFRLWVSGIWEFGNFHDRVAHEEEVGAWETIQLSTVPICSRNRLLNFAKLKSSTYRLSRT